MNLSLCLKCIAALAVGPILVFGGHWLGGVEFKELFVRSPALVAMVAWSAGFDILAFALVFIDAKPVDAKRLTAHSLEQPKVEGER